MAMNGLPKTTVNGAKRSEDLRKQLRAKCEAFALMRHGLAQMRPAEYAYDSTDDYILAKGGTFSQEPLTADEKKALRKFAAQMEFPGKLCFMNAFHLAEAGERLGFQYAEGVGFSVGVDILPIQHAWAVWHDKVIDPTWRSLTDIRTGLAATIERIDQNLAGASYLGLTIPLDYLRKLQRKSREYGPAIDDYLNGWPMLRKDFSFKKERA